MIIAFDLDSVLCDLTTEWMAKYNKEFNDNVKPSDLKEWDIRKFIKPEADKIIFSYINKVGFYSNVKPIPYFIEMARDYTNQGHEVFVCTSCNNNYTMIGEKVKWLKKHTPFIPVDNFMFVNNKGLARADLLVDDRVINVERFLKNNKFSRGLIVRASHNESEIGRVIREQNYSDRINVTEGVY